MRPLPPPLDSTTPPPNVSPPEKALHGRYNNALAALLPLVQDHCKKAGIAEGERVLHLDTPCFVPHEWPQAERGNALAAAGAHGSVMAWIIFTSHASHAVCGKL
jgi:hypothetical protein